ncbi:MAG TPA: bifunctional (p)ppGpp synthetase/guanosine-3',5'-bis(diphosphate) 3'-pyrophosphohydrolase [Candidatus Nanoarchaeia archaeon]|nr:bifunctional (p)ppGpp synthetase/guanosine-3',5'-bis(diphosphate) 3'-pyrophosphohydrolase [Candidatus Nanoarchaeia archaeon]
MQSLPSLLRRIKQYNPKSNVELIQKAYFFADSAHKGEVRLSSEPYIKHPLNVAFLLADLKSDDKTIAAALLHDVIEDCNIPSSTIEKEFGKEITFLVDGVTRISKLGFGNREDFDSENMKKMLLASAKDIRVILIKLADRLHNMRTLEYLSTERQISISKFTLSVYAPLAYRLGLGEIKAELEDLSFKYLNPEEYKEIKEKLELRIKKRKSLIEEVKTKLLRKLKQSKINCRIDGRAKHIYGIYRKIHFREIPFDKIYDLIALRIIVKTIEECYNTLGIIHGLYKPLQGYLKDYIATPKENMYRSIHTVVLGPAGEPLEIQIRTEEMHAINEEGIAAHYRYKGLQDDETFQKKLKWIREILEWQKTADSSEFIENLKIDLFDYEIFVFTPKGDIVNLPKGSTPIDFAYNIHSQIGDKCTGAKVNNKYVPLNYELSNGDIVSITTNKNHLPVRDWLKFVRTNKAKSKIIQSIKEQGLPIINIKKTNFVNNESIIKVEGLKNPKIKFSRCCDPSPSEKIKGYVDIGQSVVIHSITCDDPQKNIKKINVSWNQDFNSSLNLKIIAFDKVGLLGNLLNIFYTNKIKINDVSAKPISDKLAECDFNINVRSLEQLSLFLNKLKSRLDVKKVQIGELILNN